MIKVVGGKHRGRALATPEGLDTRPTASRARESLFNILAHANWRPDGTSPLNDAAAIKAIGENLRKLGETGAAKVVRADVTRPPPSREGCDLVFLDPPYRSGLVVPALTALADAGWMKPGAVVTVELANTEDVIPPPGFEALDERRYGAAKIVILRRTS
jgi:16S rRNA (guanine966-N2)-methyltransferase